MAAVCAFDLKCLFVSLGISLSTSNNSAKHLINWLRTEDEMYKEEKKPFATVVSIALSSYTAMAITHPLDVVKVRLQKDRAICNSYQVDPSLVCPKTSPVQEASCDCIPHTSTIKALEYLGRNEGIKTLWSGFFERSIMAVNPLVYFPLMEKAKSLLYKHKEFPDFLVPSAAAGASRSFTILMTFPLEYIATLKQANEQYSFSKMKQFATGLEPLFVRDVTFSIILWSVTDSLRQFLCNRKRSETNARETLMLNAFCGSIGAVIASFITYPLDILKTRWQVIDSLEESPNKKRIISSLRHIYENEGMESFYYGLGAKMSRSAIAGGLVIGLYEFFYQIIQDARNK